MAILAGAIASVKWRMECRLRSITEGGSGSGNYGHAGRPGEIGGSGEGGGDRSKTDNLVASFIAKPNIRGSKNTADALRAEIGNFGIRQVAKALGYEGKIPKSVMNGLDAEKYEWLAQQLGGMDKVKEIAARFAAGAKFQDDKEISPMDIDKISSGIYFHGTNSDALEGIMSHGLQADDDRRTFESEEFYTGSRKNAVFVSDDKSMAFYYARNAMNTASFKAKPAVLKIKIPAGVKIRSDKVDDFLRTQAGERGLKGAEKGRSFYVKGGIDPKWIESITIYDGQTGKPLSVVANKKFRGHESLDSPIVGMVCYVGLAIRDHSDEKEKVKSESITEGGSGSGNYGHAGRPGEVGGSGEGGGEASSGGEVITYHATMKNAIKGILKDGIVPKGGAGLVTGAKAGTGDYMTGGRAESTYVTKSEKDATEYGNMLAVSRKCDAYVIFKIVIPKDIKLTHDELDAKRHRMVDSYMVKGKILPEWIKEYSLYEPPRFKVNTVKIQESIIFGIFYVPVIILKKK